MLFECPLNCLSHFPFVASIYWRFSLIDLWRWRGFQTQVLPQHQVALLSLNLLAFKLVFVPLAVRMTKRRGSETYAEVRHLVARSILHHLQDDPVGVPSRLSRDDTGQSIV